MKKRVRNERESSIYIPSENVREKLRNNADDPLYFPVQDNAELNKFKEKCIFTVLKFYKIKYSLIRYF